MLQRFAAIEGRADEDPQVRLHPILADVLVEGARPQRRLIGAVEQIGVRIEQPAPRGRVG